MSMVKVISPGAWQFDGPISQLVDVCSTGIDRQWLTKRAAAGVFSNVEIPRRPGHAFVHVLAMGDSEHYGFNRNGDAYFESGGDHAVPFPKSAAHKTIHINVGNKECYPTFEKFAHVFRHHKNEDAKKKSGDVYKAAHNDNMHRVELLLDLPENEWRDDLQKLAEGKDVPWSQACKVPADFCSACGNKASSKDGYCEHLKDQMSQILKSGHVVGALNDYMRYFDISRVTVPADRIAFGLLKAASLGDPMWNLPGAELATQLGYSDGALSKRAEQRMELIRKLAAIEKEIEAVSPASSKINQLAAGLPKHELNEKDRSQLKVASSDIPALLSQLSDSKIILSLPDFVKLVTGKHGEIPDEMLDGAKCELPGIFSKLEKDPGDFDDFEMKPGLLPGNVARMIERMIPDFSLDSEPARRRISVTIIRGGKTPDVRAGKPSSMDKKSAFAEGAQAVAEAYAKYKVVALERALSGGLEDPLTKLAVLSHYVWHS